MINFLSGRAKIILLITLILALVLGGAAYYIFRQKSSAGIGTQSVDYTSIIRTETYPTVRTQVQKSVKLKSAYLYYKYPEQSFWPKVRMKITATDDNFKT